MTNIIIHGRLDLAPSMSDVAKSFPGQVTPKYSAQIQTARAATDTHRLDVADDDIVELELEGGVRLWQRADTLQADFPGVATRGAAGGGYVMPAILPLGTVRRGVGPWVIKALRVFGIDVAGDIAEIASSKVEGKLKPGPGLYRCGSSAAADLKPVGTLDPTQPTLVLIHGTNSTTEGSFGGLWEGGSGARYAELDQAYRGQVLAFQHRTLTMSPIENALELAGKLPDSARLHLVSHSRGGLVGELLCRAMLQSRSPFDDDDLALFATPERKRDLEALTALRKLLADKKFQIERFVRVACPARGTTLADGRLDRYLSITVNLLGLIPGFMLNPVYDATTALLLAVVKKRTDPQELPGLEAQMPTSPLIRVLNRPGQVTSADLHVVGGDLAGSTAWSTLKALVTDLYYREDNDLVVNTPSMFGGAERTGVIRYWIDTGGGVDHFHYFKNPDTASRVVAALLRPDSGSGGVAAQQADEGVFHPLEKKPSEITPEDYRKRTAAPQPIVVVLPGIMGSTLKAGDNSVWMNYLALAAGGLADLDMSVPNVEPSGLVADSYQRLVRYLSLSHEVIPFAYDWRKTITDAANRLRAVLEQALAKADAHDQPVRIIAHSMGGLVVRAMLADADGQKVWQRMCANPGARFVMLGTPNGGSHAITSMLIGRDALVKKLALLDFRHGYGDLLNYITRFVGVLELLPHRGTLDAYQPESWQALRIEDLAGQRGIGKSEVATSKSAGFAWLLPDATQLTEARRIRDLLRASPIDPDRMIYVAGCADATAIDITVDPAAPAGQRVAVVASAEGDGRVPWATGIPRELAARTYYIDAVHGDLANVPDTFPALLDLLTLGTTTKLSKAPPVRRSAAGGTFVLPAEVPAMFPDEQEILCAAMGSSRRDASAKEPERKVKIRVVHGNLSGAATPVVIGHYEGDTIVSAEAYMDRQLAGRLREAQRMHLYPGQLNTVKLFLNDQELCARGAHPGAIITGLGTVGELSSGALAGTVANAATAYALARIEEERARRKTAAAFVAGDVPLNISLTSLLIGSGEAGLTVADSLQAVLRGVHQANLRLKEVDRAQQPVAAGFANPARAPITAFIDRIYFVELWEDQAIRAAKALLRLGTSSEIRASFDVDELLVEGRDGQRRADYEEERNWWQRVRVTTEKNGALKFETFVDRARSESWLQPTQQKLVKSFLERATASSATDPNVSFTLFELLVPNALKQAAPDRRNLAIMLDEEAAAYPWELLQDRFDDASAPLSVQAGMVRQLVLPEGEFRAKVVHAAEFSALVIGDPTSSDPSPDFPALPGAAAEARAVAKHLRDRGYQQVVELVEADATPEATLNALYARPYRILHLAGHGAFEYAVYGDVESDEGNSDAPARTITGMALSKGIFLTPAEIEQMRVVPELVFINCCHLGEMTGEAPRKAVPYHKLAANVAAQFIRMGVRAVVAAGWAVDDRAASIFATKFYDSMLSGVAFGDAVQSARSEVYRSGGGSNTWGAYQCYGDPDFSLGVPRQSSRAGDRIVAGMELRRLVEVIALRAKTADSASAKRMLDDLRTLASSSDQGWMESSATCAALGKAFGELGSFEEALTYYQKSRTLHPSDATVESLENLANLSGRSALELFADMLGTRAAGAPREVQTEADKLFAGAEAILDALLVIGKTSERLSLKGSLYKRKAMVTGDSKERRRLLQQMADFCNEAYELGVAKQAPDAYYSLANRLAAEIVLAWPSSAKSPRTKAARERLNAIKSGLEQIRSIAAQTKPGTDFWTDTLMGNVLLGTCMARQELNAADLETILAVYSNAAIRGGSERALRSVTDNIRFFQAMADPGTATGAKDSLVESLELLRKGVIAAAATKL
jgi:tetratricopeptide (TPR) repeat protein